MDSLGLEVRNENNWVILTVKDRVDSFNYQSFKSHIETALGAGNKNLAVDLSKAKFLSLISIKYICSVAEGLKKDGGHLALLSASEKLKRQFDIYASLDELSLAKSSYDLI